MEYEVDPFSDHVIDPGPPADQIKRFVFRTGLVIVAVGLLIALVGAAQRAQTGDQPGSVAQGVHHVGKVVMLLGLFVLLVAHRVRRFLELSKMTQSSSKPQLAERVSEDSPTSSPAVSRRQSDERSSRPSTAANIAMLAAIVMFCVFCLFAVLFAPSNLAGVLLVFFIPAMTAGMIIVTVYGSSLQKTFCIGALVPWCTMVVLYLMFWVSILARPGLNGRNFRPGGNVILWLEFQATQVLGALDQMGVLMRTPLIIILVIALLTGLFAVVVRIVLHGINRELT